MSRQQAHCRRCVHRDDRLARAACWVGIVLAVLYFAVQIVRTVL